MVRPGYEAVYTFYIIINCIAPGDYIGFSSNAIGTVGIMSSLTVAMIVDDNIYEGDTEYFTVSLAPVIQDPRITLNISVATIFIEDNGKASMLYL